MKRVALFLAITTCACEAGAGPDQLCSDAVAHLRSCGAEDLAEPESCDELQQAAAAELLAEGCPSLAGRAAFSVDCQSPGKATADPAVVLKTYTGPLVKGGISYRDVVQGNGDCYFAAAAAATVALDPAYVYRRMFRKGASDQYLVRFGAASAPRAVCVDRQLWTGTGCYGAPTGCANDDPRYWQVLYGCGEDDRRGPYPTPQVKSLELWWPLLEKAYAKHRGGYTAIDGDPIGRGLRDLHGGASDLSWCVFDSPTTIWTKLVDAWRRRQPVTFEVFWPNPHGVATEHIVAIVGVDEPAQKLKVWDTAEARLTSWSPLEVKKACRTIAVARP